MSVEVPTTSNKPRKKLRKSVASAGAPELLPPSKAPANPPKLVAEVAASSLKTKKHRSHSNKGAQSDECIKTGSSMLPSATDPVLQQSGKKKKRSCLVLGNAAHENEVAPMHTLPEIDNLILSTVKKVKKKLRFADSNDELVSPAPSAPATNADQSITTREEKEVSAAVNLETPLKIAEGSVKGTVHLPSDTKGKKKKDMSDSVRTSSEERSSSTKKSKKRKAESALEDNPLATDRPKPSKKNRKSTTTKFPDPGADESLSEQAKKGECYSNERYMHILMLPAALEYAFAQFTYQKTWKFHKARQNWILRNLWSETAVCSTS